MAVFDMLRDQLHIVLWGFSTVIQGKVSLDRLTDFLNNVSSPLQLTAHFSHCPDGAS